MTSLCVTPIKGRVVRVMKLDTCGNPVTGASSSVVVSDGFISVHPTPQYEDGVEFFQRNASGGVCVNQKDPGVLKRIQAESMWCVLDPDLKVIMDGARLITTGSATGTGGFFSEGQVTQRFSVEVWQNIAGRAACTASGQQQYVYWAYPNCGNAQIQDFTHENDMLQWHEQFETQPAGPLWGTLPTTLPPNGYLSGSTFNSAIDHFAYNITTVAPPAASCGAVLLA